MQNANQAHQSPSPGSGQDPAKIFRAGLLLLRNDNVMGALVAFENAFGLDPEEPIYMSYLGLARVLLRKDVKVSVELCEKAAEKNLYHPEIFHNLGRVYLMRGQRKKALDALNSGLRIDKNNADILLELQRMGQRGVPPVPFLRRDNPLNFYLGKFFGKLGLR
jgi:tetratricopeptide (TPR) repeat protein